MIVTKTQDLTDDQLKQMALDLGRCFAQDPICRRFFGCEYDEGQHLWNASFYDDLLKAQAIGDIYLASTEDTAKEIVGYAACFPPGHDLSDRPSTDHRKLLDDAQSDAQKAFRSEFAKLQAADYAAVYPNNFKRDNQYVYHFAVKDGWRRQGVGSSLIKKIVDEAKESGHGTVLDTSKWENVLFYQANGFSLKSSFEIEHFKYGPLPKMYTLSTGA